MFRQGKVKLVKGAFGKIWQNDAKCKLNLGPYLGQSWSITSSFRKLAIETLPQRIACTSFAASFSHVRDNDE